MEFQQSILKLRNEPEDLFGEGPTALAVIIIT